MNKTAIATINNTLFTYTKTIYSPTLDGDLSDREADMSCLPLAIVEELSYMGYKLSYDEFLRIAKLTPEELSDLHKEVMAFLSAKIGEDKIYYPLFAKFPFEVPNSATYFFKRLMHIFNISDNEFDSADFNYNPVTQCNDPEKDRTVRRERTPSYKTPDLLLNLSFCQKDEVFALFDRLVATSTPLPERDINFLSTMIDVFGHELSLPEKIDNREVKVIVTYGFYKNDIIDKETFESYYDTATDILRLGALMSGGDVSLATKTKFSLKKGQARTIMSCLDSLAYAGEDMKRYRTTWLILLKHIHAGVYGKVFPTATKHIDTIRNKEKEIITFDSKVESLLVDLSVDSHSSAIDELVSLLKGRAGVFARRLDKVLRSTSQPEKVVDGFLSVADQVPTAILIDLCIFYKNRDDLSIHRVFLSKKVSTSSIKEDTRNKVDVSHYESLSHGIQDVLVERFSHLPDMGNVLIDEKSLGGVTLPKGLSSTSDNLSVVGRGTKLYLSPETKFLRMFAYWENQENGDRVDVDLSSVAYNEDFEVTVKSYYGEYQSHSKQKPSPLRFSGDVQDGDGGASEFIDIDIELLKNYFDSSTRYVAIAVNSYTGQNFSQFLCTSGVMELSKEEGDIEGNVNSYKYKSNDELFIPSNVKANFPITSSSRFVVPVIFDLKEMCMIWLDQGIHSTSHMNIMYHLEEIKVLTQYALNIRKEKATLLDLISLHAKARGQRVDTEKDPDIEYDHVFDEDFALDTSSIMSHWMR